MSHEILRFLFIGAHPGDGEWYVGGVAALYAQLGHQVVLASLANGDQGHHALGGAPLARRRRAEAEAGAALLGAQAVVLDNHDGAIQPTLEYRQQVIALLREFRPHLVATHRLYDYHPDHRYTGQLVQDAVGPASWSGTMGHLPPLPHKPVVVFCWDGMRRPYPFEPDVAIDVGAVFEHKVDAIACHVSQFFEGAGASDIPAGPGERRAWFGGSVAHEQQPMVDSCRPRLLELYGEQRGTQVKHAECFEVCEHGAPLTAEQLRRLFPFFP